MRKKKTLTHEQAYVKAICRAQREAVGFQPSVIQRNRKKYRRADEKRRPIPEDD